MLRYFAWANIGQVVLMFVQLVYGIIIARLVEPEIFGFTAIPLTIVACGRMLVDGGISGAIVRDPEPSTTAYSSVFIYTTFIGLGLCLLLFSWRNLISNSYGIPQMRSLILVASLTIALSGFQVIFNAHVTRTLNYKFRAVCQTIASLLAALTSLIIIAKYDHAIGIMAYPFMNGLLISMLFFGRFGKLIYPLTIATSDIKKYLAFGINTSLGLSAFGMFNWFLQSSVLTTYGSAPSGYYMQSRKFTDLKLNLTKGNLSSVLFAILAKTKERESRHIGQLLISITLLYAVLNVFGIIFIPSLLVLFLGSEWLETQNIVPVLMALSFSMFFDEQFRLLHKLDNQTAILRNFDFLKYSFLSCAIAFNSYTKILALQDFILVISVVWLGLALIHAKLFLAQYFSVGNLATTCLLGLGICACSMITSLPLFILLFQASIVTFILVQGYHTVFMSFLRNGVHMKHR